MMIAILFLSTIGYVSLLRKKLGLKFTTAQFIYVALVVICLYIFGIFGLLRAGVVFIGLVGLCVFAFMSAKYVNEIYRHIKTEHTYQALNLAEKESSRSSNYFFLLNPKFASLLINGLGRTGWNVLYLFPFVVLHRLISEEFLFTGWDEFSHWALSIKIVYETDSLYLERTPMMYKHYPPIQQLFQYYYLQFAGWTEKNVLFAQGSFVLSALICAIGELCKKSSLLAILALAVSCAIFYFFGYDFSHIYVDPLLAAVFASCLIIAVNEERRKGATLLLVMLPVLVLIKQTGLILSLVVVSTFSIGLFLQTITQTTIEDKSISYKKFGAFIFYSGIVVMAVALSYKSWQWYLSSINAVQILEFPSPLTLLEPPMLGRFGLTVLEFVRRLETNEFLLMGSPLHRFSLDELSQIFKSTGVVQFVWVLFNEIEYSNKILGYSLIDISVVHVFLSGISIALYRKCYKRSLAIFFISILIGCVGYLCFLLMSYLLFFKEVESIALVSFERYAATFYLAWTIVILCVITSSVIGLKSKVINVIFVSVLFIIVAFAPPQFFRDMRGITSPPALVETRLEVERLANIAKIHMRGDDKAYFVVQNSSGFEKYVFNYSILPFESSWWCWSLGAKYSINDSWTCDAKLVDLVKGYNFLVVYRADQQFWKENEYLLDASDVPKSSGVYKILLDNNLPTRLIEIKN